MFRFGNKDFFGGGGGKRNERSRKSFRRVELSRGRDLLEQNKIQVKTISRRGRRRTGLLLDHDLGQNPKVSLSKPCVKVRLSLSTSGRTAIT